MLHEHQPVVLASPAMVFALLRQQHRERGSQASAGPADLVPGAHLQATTAACRGRDSKTVELRLLGLAELPRVRQALLQLLAAPSIAGPAGWQLGWLQHSGQQQQGSLAVACHVAVLLPASPGGAAALRSIALPWPAAATGSGSASTSSMSSLLQGQLLAAVGAPFGALAPQHFGGFIASGVLSAVVPGSSASAGREGAIESPALLLSDLRCSPGMEGGPVFAAVSSPAEQQCLVGMLLPPLKLPAAHVELALAAPAAAVAAAAAEVLRRSACAMADCNGSSGVGGVAASAAAAHQPVPCIAALPAAAPTLPAVAVAAGPSGVVAVATGSSWASGVVVSSAGHVMTNAHLLQPTAAAAVPPSSSEKGEAPLQLAPASEAAAAAAAAALQVHAPVRVLLPAAVGRSGTGGSWSTADVLYIFSGPLDLAVLQLRQEAHQSERQRQRQQQQQQQQQLLLHMQTVAAPQPLRLSRQPPRAGQAVCVLGFPAFNPRGSPHGGTPLVTSGNLAKVRRIARTGAAAPAALPGGLVSSPRACGKQHYVTGNRSLPSFASHFGAGGVPAQQRPASDASDHGSSAQWGQRRRSTGRCQRAAAGPSHKQCQAQQQSRQQWVGCSAHSVAAPQFLHTRRAAAASSGRGAGGGGCRAVRCRCGACRLAGTGCSGCRQQ